MTIEEDKDRELEEMIMVAALYLVQDRTRKVSDMEIDFLSDLTIKINAAYAEQVGTIH